MHLITFVPFPFQNEKKLPFCNIHRTLSFTDILSTEACITIFIQSAGAVIVRDMQLEMPPEIKVIITQGSPKYG